MLLINDALRACDVELRQILAGNIVLTGGGSQFTGFADRLAAEAARMVTHVCALWGELIVFTNMLFCLRQKYMPLETLSNAAMVVGWEEVFWAAWVPFISYGSVEKSGRSVCLSCRQFIISVCSDISIMWYRNMGKPLSAKDVNRVYIFFSLRLFDNLVRMTSKDSKNVLKAKCILCCDWKTALRVKYVQQVNFKPFTDWVSAGSNQR